MDRIGFIRSSTAFSNQKTQELIATIEDDMWYVVPEVIQSGIAWQVGHLILGQHYNAILLIRGVDPTILAKVPIREYAKKYGSQSNPAHHWDDAPSPQTLRSQLEFINIKAAEVLDELSDQQLDEALVPSKFPHPFAKTKYEALSWNAQHIMWHNGQIAMIKRALRTHK